ncbi:MAG: VOC family protein [Pseudomonadales bacterium]|nr:VOC family protein [Pseudomonadales bacterium]
MLNQVSAILLVSKSPEALAAFYSRAFGLSFRRELHDDMEPHFGGYLGATHIGIHPPGNFPDGPETGAGGAKVTFDTLDFDALIHHLREERIPLHYEPVTDAWSRMTARRDPDGNFIELLQPCNEVLRAAASRGQATGEKVETFIASGGGYAYGTSSSGRVTPAGSRVGLEEMLSRSAHLPAPSPYPHPSA